jgi:acyl carrier protein
MNKFDKKICDKVLSSFAWALKINSSDVNVEKNFSEFSNLDSLGFVKLIISLNEKFNIELDTDHVLKCDNIIQLSIYIESLMDKKN